MAYKLRNSSLLGKAVICGTGLSDDDRTRMATIVKMFGGGWSSMLSDTVTHLVCRRAEQTQKFKAAVLRNIPVVNATWLETIQEQAGAGHLIDPHHLLRSHAILPLSGIVISVTGIPEDTRNVIRALCEQNEATYHSDMTDSVDYLIADRRILMENSEVANMKVEYAKMWDVPIVDASWLYDSIKEKHPLDPEAYSVFKKTRNLFRALKFYINPNIDNGKALIALIEENGGEVVETLDDKADWAIFDWMYEESAPISPRHATANWIRDCHKQQVILPADQSIFYRPYNLAHVLPSSVIALQGLKISISKTDNQSLIVELMSKLKINTHPYLSRDMDVLLNGMDMDVPSRKMKCAKMWSIPTLNIRWVLDCLVSGTCGIETIHLYSSVEFERLKQKLCQSRAIRRLEYVEIEEVAIATPDEPAVTATEGSDEISSILDEALGSIRSGYCTEEDIEVPISKAGTTPIDISSGDEEDYLVSYDLSTDRDEMYRVMGIRKTTF